MNDLLRKQYLHSMGIPLWRLRHAAVPTASDLLTSENISDSNAHSSAENSSSECDLLWQHLQKDVASCTACGLCKTRTQTVLGVGHRNAKLLIIGEAPGAQEDRQGLPFVGRAGQLLESMLLSIGLDRQQVYIANILKCRPPNNRDPERSEVDTCTPFLKRQLSLIQPRLIVALGRIAAHFLLNTTTPMNRLRQQQYTYGENKIPLLVTFHPAYLLRSPLEKSKAYDDLLLIKELLTKI